MLLGKDQLNTIDVLVSKSLNNSYISHDKFISMNNVLNEYNDMKEIKQPWNFCGIYYIKTMETYCVSCNKNTENENSNVRKTK